VVGTDHLALIRNAPERMVAAGSSRVLHGNLAGGPEGELVAFEKGVTDFGRRWTYSHQELHGLPPVPQGHRVGAFQRLAQGVSDALTRPRDVLYVDGKMFTLDADGRFIAPEHETTDMPRHPNDPVWCLDVLYGAGTPIDVLDESHEDGDVHLHLAAVAELSAADRISPHGVRPGIASQGSERERMPFHVWLIGDRVVRVSIEHVSPRSARERFWSATEFSDFGIDVEEAWNSMMSHRGQLGSR
jgi:hypothetical protein